MDFMILKAFSNPDASVITELSVVIQEMDTYPKILNISVLYVEK